MGPPSIAETKQPNYKYWLIAAIGVYCVAVVWYFFVSQDEYLKYFITIGGIALGTVVRETVDKDAKILRLIAILVPALVIAAVQAHDGHKARVAQEGDKLEKERKRARDLEARTREVLILNPRDAIDQIRNADQGFLAKAEMLAFRATLPGLNRNAVLRLNRLEAAYRSAASDFIKELKPKYDHMASLDERDRKAQKEFSAKLLEVAAIATQLAARHRIAGPSNHAAVLSQALRRAEQTLAFAFQAVTLEPDHLPAYETIGYALWIFNEDASGGLKYADLGLKECEDQRKLIGQSSGNAYSSHLRRMESNLKLQYAYFSAIQYVNEAKARGFAREEFDRAKNDAEVQDTLGYVLLRFAKNRDEIQEAIKLFTLAADNPKAERVTKNLAFAHLQQAKSALEELRAR